MCGAQILLTSWRSTQCI